MNDVLQVRLGRKRAESWRQFLQRTGLNQGDLIREVVDARMKRQKAGLPPVAARWCGKVKGPEATATNAAVAKAFKL